MASNEELKKLDETIQSLSEELKDENETVRRLAGELSAITSSLSKEELDKEIARMGGELDEASKRLEMIKSGQKKVNPNEKQRVDKDYTTLSKVLKERKGKCSEIVGELLEHIPKKREELIEEIGLDMQQ